MKPLILWIEDGAGYDLRNIAAPVYTSGRYVLNIAENATAAIERLRQDEYSAVIVDVRLPPGRGIEWLPLWNEAKMDKVRAQLGIQLLYAILQHPEARIVCQPFPWLTVERIGLFTVETHQDLQDHLRRLGITVFREKCAGMPQDVLLEMIQEIHHRRAIGE